MSRQHRNHVRPCRSCREPILGAAHNQVLHPDCQRRDDRARRRRRHAARRAARPLSIVNCRVCHRRILDPALNQEMHRPCRDHATEIRRRRRREIQRASLGLWPLEKKRLDQIELRRRQPTAKTRARYYTWHTCPTPDCGERYFAGKGAKACPTCTARHRREAARRRNILWIARHFPERIPRIGSLGRSLARPA